ncbi:gephyrin-like molybdotransferase Glp [Methylobacterium sp. Leaf108]|uniref:molybdopterin molybdotransferase MoeA n=1 Tax=Methylobacterium sp. Leaf108 TaxID=1736256 RepID=UPI0006F64DD5|nr:gephyrin-like molybdotransferase Glp [Methylobacterium sp. Leaf108]KQP51745.1 molybdopterin biosynthesis protein MoeA [Methylobacterium sp. Leaf108]
MAQLTDDCFAFGGSLLSIEEAIALMQDRLPVLAGCETVPLDEADGRIAAADVLAGIDLPPFDNSAVDGYALRHADLDPAGETVLPVAGRIAAGATGPGLAIAGNAVRIFTGAPMPAGADTVFMQEDVRREGDVVGLPTGLKRGANRRLAGEDVTRGTIVVPAGRRLRPQDLALAAAVGHAALSVRRRLRVAVFSTGNELTEPGAPLPPGGIYDANRIMLVTLLRRLGVAVADLGLLRDDRGVLTERLAAAAADHDLVLTSGGVSTGEEDHVKAAVEAAGQLMFWRLGIKPGRPVAMGTISGTPFVGLPGNPVAAYVTLVFVVRPLLARLGGATYLPPIGIPARAGFAYAKKTGRREFVRVSLHRGADGVFEARKYPRDGAGALTSLTGGDGLAQLGEERTRLDPGDTIEVFPHEVLS